MGASGVQRRRSLCIPPGQQATWRISSSDRLGSGICIPPGQQATWRISSRDRLGSGICAGQQTTGVFFFISEKPRLPPFKIVVSIITPVP